ncbi:MAG: type 1 glutamine amidotransferase domain-containing protein [Smithella sp.]
MAKIAIIIADMFEDSEYSEPAEAFKKAGHEIIHVGLIAGSTVKGEKKGTTVKIDENVRDADVSMFDALMIPGGYSPDHLRVDEDAVQFTKEFVESGKPVFIICHGPQLLITADVLRGRKITGWKSVKQDIINAGAEFIDNKVVEDDNFISSRSPADLPDFIEACLNKLESGYKSRSAYTGAEAASEQA